MCVRVVQLFLVEPPTPTVFEPLSMLIICKAETKPTSKRECLTFTKFNKVFSLLFSFFFLADLAKILEPTSKSKFGCDLNMHLLCVSLALSLPSSLSVSVSVLVVGFMLNILGIFNADQRHMPIFLTLYLVQLEAKVSLMLNCREIYTFA